MNAYVDANIFVFAALDGGTAGEKAAKILSKIQNGETSAATSALALDEIMWVFVKNKKRHLLEQVLKGIYEMPNLMVLPVSAHAPLAAVEFMTKFNLQPRDALHCAIMRENGLKTIFSDDADFDKVKEFSREF